MSNAGFRTRGCRGEDRATGRPTDHAFNAHPHTALIRAAARVLTQQTLDAVLAGEAAAAQGGVVGGAM